MKKIGYLVLLVILTVQVSCNKSSITNPTNDNVSINKTARTVDGITFTGQIAWLKFGTREEINSNWECTGSYDFCEYDYIASAAGYIPIDGEATGEIGYNNEGILMIALDVNSLTSYDNNNYYTRDGEFHFDAREGTFTTSGFTMKNLADPDQTTAGDITVAAGDYPVYEDATSALIIFEAD